MNINIELQRKPEDYRLDNCVIDVVEEIPHESFETFQNYPTARYGAITNSLHRLPEELWRDYQQPPQAPGGHQE